MANTAILIPPARRTKGYIVQFQWNANVEPEVTGYKLYPSRVSETYDVDDAVDMGDNTTGSYSIRRPDGLGWWYFKLSAYTATLESALSTEASINITSTL